MGIPGEIPSLIQAFLDHSCRAAYHFPCDTAHLRIRAELFPRPPSHLYCMTQPVVVQVVAHLVVQVVLDGPVALANTSVPFELRGQGLLGRFHPSRSPQSVPQPRARLRLSIRPPVDHTAQDPV